MKHPEFIMMAPMEGVIDATMRELFSAIGGIDRMVTEFVRISNTVLPEKVYKKYCPELVHQSHTKHGTPVYVQLLGDNPDLLAQNAQRAAKLGAIGIDLNFGCPAKTVNNHGGGSVLLKQPERIYQITHAVKKILPEDIPLTVKIRLGYEDSTQAIDIAQAAADANATQLAIHARTKTQGYKPPAYWQDIASIKEAVDIDIIANGEIWTIDDLQRCMQQSNCSKIMLGRGLVASPELALFAKGVIEKSLSWADILLLLAHYHKMLQDNCPAKYQNNLIKQWLIYLRTRYGEAHLFFEKVKRLREPQLMLEAIAQAQKLQQYSTQPKKIGQLTLLPL